MSKSESFHQFYEQCKTIRLDEKTDLLKNAESEEEQDFILHVTDYILQQKQAQVIAEKRF